MTYLLGGRARTRLLAIVAVAAMAAAIGVVAVGPASAVGAAHPTLVSTVPATSTPNINDGVVYAIAQVGSWIVVGGSFTAVTPHGGSLVPRSGVFAFDQATGALATGFAPTLDGTVQTLIAGPTPNTVYVGGGFNTVNGANSKSLALLDLNTGLGVSGFKAPSMNGIVYDIRLTGGHLILAGSFTTLTGLLHQGIGAVNPATGGVDPYVNIALTGHHNYTGTGASGAVGGRALDISPDGTRAVVIGNFKDANAALHDQIVMLDLGSAAVTIDPGWNTAQYSAPCSSNSFDSYVSDVDFSPDGTYFAVATTGGGTFATNVDGTRGLCDSMTRWETGATGANVKPTWVDYTGNDTFWTVTVTGTAVYGGGHARWINNPLAADRPGAGAVPRPGIVALDPINGLPYSWNPGRNPRGAGAYALLATAQGLYVGSDTDYIGKPTYTRKKIAFFPLAGGETPPSTATAALPANVYLAGPLPGGSATSPSADTLTYRPLDGSTIGAQSTVATSGITWSTTRGAFLVDGSLFYPSTDGNFYRASFDGTSAGTPVVLDAYDDPAWKDVVTGSHKETHETYQGVKPDYYAEVASITGQFYSNGRIYYALAGKTALYWRYFEPDDGVVGGTEFAVTGADFSAVEGMALSGTTLYYAGRSDGQLRSLPFVNGTPSPGGATIMSASGVDWRARSLFLHGPPDPTGGAPEAAATITCHYLTCTFDGSASSDPGGTITRWSWDFGDHATAVGTSVTHTYTTGGNRSISLAVTDDRALIDNWTGTAAAVGRSTTTSVTCSPATVRVNATTSCTLTAKDTSSAPATAPAGTVHLISNGSGTLSPSTCTLRAARPAATATCVVHYQPRSRGSGAHTLTGTYSGDGTHSTSRGARRLSVLPLIPKVALASTHLIHHPKTIPIGVRCAVTTCRGTVLVYIHHTMGKASYAVTAGRSREVTVNLTTYGKKVLKSATRRHAVHIKVRITVAGGATVTRSATVT